jgi:hypothetical protein
LKVKRPASRAKREIKYQAFCSGTQIS